MRSNYSRPNFDRTSGGEGRVGHEVLIDSDGCSSSFSDTPARITASVSYEKTLKHWNGSAYTIRLCPRRQSPAAKIPSTFVAYFPTAVLTLLRPSCSRLSALIAASSGPKNPSARRTLNCRTNKFRRYSRASLLAALTDRLGRIPHCQVLQTWSIVRSRFAPRRLCTSGVSQSVRECQVTDKS